MGTSATFTVYFEGPFWVGVLEIRQGDGVRAARHVFGAEPTDPQLYDFAVGGGFDALGRAAARAASVPAGERSGSRTGRPVSPKRAARQAARQAREPAVSTAAQRALQRAREANRTLARQEGRAERERRAAWRRQVAVRKAKDRHRGR